MGRFFCFLVCIANFVELFSIEVHSDIGAVAIINGDTGRVLYSRAADECFYPASTTKIATVLYILDVHKPKLQQKILASKEAVRTIPDSEKARNGYRFHPSYLQEGRGTAAGYLAGDELTVEDAMYGALLPSGNDAANILAETFDGGSIETFISGLNEYLKQIGCSQTNFTNPHGLHHPDHVTTAFDLARIAQRALKNPAFRTIVSSTEYNVDVPGRKKRNFRQGNLLMREGPHFSAYAIGLKTGHHARARHCLVAGYEKDGRLLIGVFLKCIDRKNMFKEMKRLFDEFAKEEIVSKTYVKPGSLNVAYVVPELGVQVGCYTDQTVQLEFYPSEEPTVSAFASWADIRAPFTKGERLGILNLIEGRNQLAAIPLLAEEGVEFSFSQRIKNIITKESVIVSVLFLLTACWLIGLRQRRR